MAVVMMMIQNPNVDSLSFDSSDCNLSPQGHCKDPNFVNTDCPVAGVVVQLEAAEDFDSEAAAEEET